MPSMPILPIERMVEGLASNSERIIRAAFRQHDGTDAILNTVKPFGRIDVNHPDAMYMACANYTWRALCLKHAPRELHRFLPVTSGFDLYRVLSAQGDCDDVPQARRDMMLVLDQQITLAGAVILLTA